MTQNISQCFTDKQLQHLNERLHTLGFELGTALDQIFTKLLVTPTPFEICDASDVPQDTGGVTKLLCVVDGVCTFVDKTLTATETLTTLTLNPTTCELEYVNESGNNPNIDLTQLDICKLEPFKSLPTLTKGIMTVVSDGLGGVTKNFQEKNDFFEDCLVNIKCQKLYDANGAEFIRKVVYSFDGSTVLSTEDVQLDLVTPFNPIDPVSCEPPKKIYSVLATESVNFDDILTSNLNPPLGAVGANLILEMVPNCEAKFTVNGTVPGASNGYSLYDCASVDLGCTENSSGDPSELSQFEIIGINGCTGVVKVIYY